MPKKTTRDTLDSPAAPPRVLGPDAADMLAEIPLFSALSRRHLGKIASSASTKRYRRGGPLVRVGEASSVFYVIIGGRFASRRPAARSSCGRAISSARWPSSTGSRARRPSSPSARSRLWRSRAPKFLKVLEAEPKIALAVMATLTAACARCRAAATV